MKRTKLNDRILPNYTKGDEIFNSVTHMVGGALGIVATVLCVVVAALNSSVYGVVGGAIFGASMTLMYTISAVYHLLSPRLTAKKVMQILDHCTIFMLIAGTYTPVALCSIREYNPYLGWTIFGVVWAAAILGIVFNSIDLKKWHKMSMILYVLMGWSLVFMFKHVLEKVPLQGILLLVGGGVFYTLGIIFFAKDKVRYMHYIWHIFVLLGTITQYFFILFYVIPL